MTDEQENLSQAGKDLAADPSLLPSPASVHRIYVGRLSCGCAVAATIDADDVAEMARNGYFIETVDAESVQIRGCQCAIEPERDAENLPDSPASLLQPILDSPESSVSPPIDAAEIETIKGRVRRLQVNRAELMELASTDTEQAYEVTIDDLCKDVRYLLAALSTAKAEGYREGVNRSAGIAHLWAASHGCDSHDDNPCCHIRTGATIEDRIRELLPAEAQKDSD